MEANKSCHLPSAGWRTRKAGSTIPSKESKAWEAGAGGVSLGLRLKGQEPEAQRRQEKMGVSAQAESASPTLPFCSVWALSGLDDGHDLREGGLLYSVYQLNADLFQKHPRDSVSSDTWVSFSPHWLIKLATIEFINDVRGTKDTGTNTTKIAWPPSSLRSKHHSWGRNSLGHFSSITFHSVLHQTLANSLEATISW